MPVNYGIWGLQAAQVDAIVNAVTAAMTAAYDAWGLTGRGAWRGLEGYVPVFQTANIPAAGGVVVVNYNGRGILMATMHAVGANPVSTQIDIDGVTIVNSASVPESAAYFIGFTTNLYVRMVSGGAGGGGMVVYLHE